VEIVPPVYVYRHDSFRHVSFNGPAQIDKSPVSLDRNDECHFKSAGTSD
jgi:hypothetical protein